MLHLRDNVFVNIFVAEEQANSRENCWKQILTFSYFLLTTVARSGQVFDQFCHFWKKFRQFSQKNYTKTSYCPRHI